MELTSSHGYIVVAPQLFSWLPGSPAEDVISTGAVIIWLKQVLEAHLPRDNVKPNFNQLVLAGHSRGGHTALALSLGHGGISLKPAALIGIDPVAGTSRTSQVNPKVLTYKAEGFNLDIPALIIGTGLGEEKVNFLMPACAPAGVNHNNFYDECPAPCYHIVMPEYGHFDVLDDKAFGCFRWIGKSGKCSDNMRRCTAGTIVASLKSVLEEEAGLLQHIFSNPAHMPCKLEHRSK